MKNDFLYDRLYNLWRRYLTADTLETGLLSDDENELVAIEYSLSERETQIKAQIQELLRALETCLKSQEPDLQQIKASTKALLVFCDKQLNELSKFDPEQPLLTATHQNLPAFINTIEQTHALLSIYSKENDLDIDQTYSRPQKNKLLSEILPMLRHFNILHTQTKKYGAAIEIGSKLKIFTENLERFAQFAENKKEGTWGDHFDGVWFHAHLYENSKKAFDSFLRIIEQYIACFHIAVKRQELPLFLNVHEPAKAQYSCMEGRLRHITDWCEKERKYYEESYTIQLKSAWETHLNSLVTQFIEDPNLNTPLLENGELNTLMATFMEHFSDDWTLFNNSQITGQEFKKRVLATLPDMKDSEISRKMNAFLEDFLTNTLCLDLEDATDTAGPSHLAAPMQMPEAFTKPKTALFSKLDSAFSIKPIEIENLASKSLLFSLLNTFWKNPETFVEKTREALAWSHELHEEFHLTAHDLVASENNCIEPILHAALRSQNPDIISLVFSLPRSQNEVINTNTLQSCLHVLATIADCDNREVLYYYEMLVAAHDKPAVLFAKDSQNQTFLHTLLSNPKIRNIDAQEVINRILKHCDFQTLHDIFLLQDNEHNTLLTLAAKRGFNSVILFILDKSANTILPRIENKISFLRNLFAPNPDNIFDSHVCVIAQNNARFGEMNFLLEAGAAQIFDKDIKRHFSQYHCDTFIHPFMRSGWSIDNLTNATEVLELPKEYWLTLYSAALPTAIDFFEKSKYLAVIRHFSPDQNPHSVNLSLQLEKLRHSLISWDIYLRSLDTYRKSSTLGRFHQSLKPCADSITPEKLMSFLKLVFFMLSVAAGGYVIYYGKFMHQTEDATWGRQLDEACLSFGGTAHGDNPANPPFTDWDVAYYTNFKQRCCLNIVECIDQYNFLWRNVADSHTTIRGVKTAGSMMVIFAWLIAVICAPLFNFFFLRPIKNLYALCEDKPNAYANSKLAVKNMRLLHQELGSFFQTLTDKKVLLEGAEALMFDSHISRDQMRQLVALAYAALTRLEIEEYTHPFIDFVIPDIALPKKPKISATNTTKTFMTTWQTNMITRKVAPQDLEAARPLFAEETEDYQKDDLEAVRVEAGPAPI